MPVRGEFQTLNPNDPTAQIDYLTGLIELNVTERAEEVLNALKQKATIRMRRRL